jgi:phosphopantothenoylcysteine decarboxylase/phosphopantothenate--cysteine ligase
LENKMLLKDKHILVGVTGSVAVYKILELIRLYIKAGANIKVIMTQASQKFITPLAFETISQNDILDDTNEDWSTQTHNNHIAIGKWADIFIIAPCTANTINKLANGYGDNILLQSALAYPKLKLIAPAANTNMIQNPITKDNLANLTKANYKLIATTTKELACRDVGDGAMAEVEDIFHTTARELLKDEYWSDRNVVLNGGGTIEKIDDVRYISNFSSGKMAVSLATALYYKGANVSLVTTSNLEIPKQIDTIKVQSTFEMMENVMTELERTKVTSSKRPYFFGVAAVSDYTPKNVSNGKMKKDAIGDTWQLELNKNIDILDSIDKGMIYAIGFKAEMDKEKAFDNAKNMLQKKNLDGVCLNILDDKNSFGSDTNKIEFISPSGTISLQEGSKLDVSLNLLDTLQEIAHD